MRFIVGSLFAGLLFGCHTPNSPSKTEVGVFQNIEPQQAHEKLNGPGGYRYLDVRTVEEFVQGHAAGAVNIPVSHRDAATGKLIPNPDFVQVVQKNFGTDQAPILGCRSGGRSSTAAKMLSEAGFKQIYNLTGGYVGAFDPAGNCVAPGWSMQGLPSSTDNAEGVSYDSLRKVK